VAKGSHRQSSRTIAARFPGIEAADIFQRTGIEERCRAAEGEDALSLGSAAARATLQQHRLTIDELDLLICATGTPMQTTPSMACSLLSRLAEDGDARVQAFDLNAACSGYLYALQVGYDFLTSRGKGKVLVVTTEHLSPLLREDDFDTAILFGDAASATVLSTEPLAGAPGLRLRRPMLSGQADMEGAIHVPAGQGFIAMNGRRVFAKAVRLMGASLQEVCTQAKLGIEELDCIVPHQANQRILDALQKRLQLPDGRIFSNIRNHGNTSSSSIPLALEELLSSGDRPEKIGLCAFGGGFTYGAAILEREQA
jgi:2-oxoisovalerate dehydrogenase E1 component